LLTSTCDAHAIRAQARRAAVDGRLIAHVHGLEPHVDPAGPKRRRRAPAGDWDRAPSG